ncbi:MAT1-1-1 [Paraphoma chrysanthemicola]|uniref:Mating-type protein MAT-1 n=1 Tax=Paraphoma chrysanthemicola TaxID=798071 RepID=A0A8K0QZM8_9PLEO|nr:MAT1-1-1 [Paraphoma chrysanthemicola]
MASQLQERALAFPDDAVVAKVSDYIKGRSGSDILEMMRSLRSPADQVALTTALLFAGPLTLVEEPAAAPEKAKKALNAFVGFRTYYITIPVFKQWPMKKLSHLIGQLWEADPNKSLWSLLAKAWSTIRDQIGKDNAPLGAYLDIICPYLQVPHPAAYLERHGWILDINHEGSPVLFRDSNITPVATLGAGLTLSVEDITGICQQSGYAQNYVPKPNSTSSTFLSQQTSVQTIRKAARDKRRAKRQPAKSRAVRDAIRQDIVVAHGGDLPYPVKDNEDAEDIEDDILDSSEFYEDLSEMLSNRDAQTETEHHNTSVESALDAPANYAEFSELIDWDAFCAGTDEDVFVGALELAQF